VTPTARRRIVLAALALCLVIAVVAQVLR